MTLCFVFYAFVWQLIAGCCLQRLQRALWLRTYTYVHV